MYLFGRRKDIPEKDKCNLIRAFNHEFEFVKSENEDEEKKYSFKKEEEEKGELYVGRSESFFEDCVDKNGFTPIISIRAPWVDIPKYENEVKVYSVRNFGDTRSSNLIRVMKKSFIFIDDAFQENPSSKILIHCTAGASRSASICAGYIMRKKKMSMDPVLESMKIDRRNVQPNHGFRQQLKMLEWNGFEVDEKLSKMARKLVSLLEKDEYREKEFSNEDFEEILKNL